jgi:hypothetical protein
MQLRCVALTSGVVATEEHVERLHARSSSPPSLSHFPSLPHSPPLPCYFLPFMASDSEPKNFF